MQSFCISLKILISRYASNQKQKILNIKNSILDTAKKTIQIESKAIAHLEQLLDDDFANAVELNLLAVCYGISTISAAAATTTTAPAEATTTTTTTKLSTANATGKSSSSSSAASSCDY